MNKLDGKIPMKSGDIATLCLSTLNPVITLELHIRAYLRMETNNVRVGTISGIDKSWSLLMSKSRRNWVVHMPFYY